MLRTEDWPLVLALLPRETGYYTKEFKVKKSFPRAGDPPSFTDMFGLYQLSPMALKLMVWLLFF